MKSTNHKSTARPLLKALGFVLLLSYALPVFAELPAMGSVPFANGDSMKLEETGLYFNRNELKIRLMSPGSVKGMYAPGAVPGGKNQKIVSEIGAVLVASTDGTQYVVFQDGSIFPFPEDTTRMDAWKVETLHWNAHQFALITYQAGSYSKLKYILINKKTGATVSAEAGSYNLKIEDKLDYNPADLANGSFTYMNARPVLLTDLTDGGKIPNMIGVNQNFMGLSKVVNKMRDVGQINFRFVNGRPVEDVKPPADVDRDDKDEDEAPEAKADVPAKGNWAALLNAHKDRVQLVNKMKKDVIGQDNVIEDLARMSDVLDDKSSQRPAVMAIVGNTGVGKTLAVESLIKNLKLKTQQSLFIEGNEFSGIGSDPAVFLHKLVGAEGAFAGAQKGMLTEFLRETNGTGVVVINNAGNMDDVVWVRLKEFFEKGSITSGKGEVFKAQNVLVVMTTSQGSQDLIPEQARDWSEEQMLDYTKTITPQRLRQVLARPQMGAGGRKKAIPVDVLNQVQTWTFAPPLTRQELSDIMKLEISKGNKNVAEKYAGVQFNFSDAAVSYLSRIGTQWVTNGRDMKNMNQKVFNDIEQAVVSALISGRWDSDTSPAIKVDLVQHDDNYFYLQLNDDVLVEVPQNNVANPLDNPRVVAKLNALYDSLTKRVIGQESMFSAIHNIALNHLADAKRSRPSVFMLVGTTGTGKTETGLALGEAVFGSDKRVGIIDMGKISHPQQFVARFERGDEGGESEMEKFLRNNPDGGVLILDEASNMGGGNPSLKNDLFKKLYDITDRGTWVSPATGIEYDLSKYIILLTGNDSEELYQAASDDQVRMQIWAQNNDFESLRRILLRSGMPEAFLGRMMAIIMTKPMLLSEVMPIAQKMLDQKLKGLEDQYGGMKITYDEHFLQDFSNGFYKNTMGIRSLRSVIDSEVGTLVHTAVLQSGMPTKELAKGTLNLQLNDNRIQTPYISKKDVGHVRQVELQGNLTVPSAVKNKKPMTVTATVNATERATPQVLQSAEQAWLTALHEVGHAVGNDPQATGEVVAHISIIGGTSIGVHGQEVRFAGYTMNRPVNTGAASHRQNFISRLARDAAGSVAEVLWSGQVSTGWSNDLAVMRKTAMQALVTGGLDSRFRAVVLDKNGEPVLSGNKLLVLEQAMDEMIDEAIILAKKRLMQNWDVVLTEALELRQKGQVDGRRFSEIWSQVYAKQAQGKTLGTVPRGQHAPFFRDIEGKLCGSVFL